MAERDDFKLYSLEYELQIYETIRALRKTPERLDKEIRANFRLIAAKVRDESRARAVARRPAPGARKRKTRQHWRNLVSTVRSGAEANSPWVAVGSEAVPWAIGHEWGTTGKNDSLGRSKLGKWPVATDTGYLLHRVLSASRNEIRGDIENAIAALYERLEGGEGSFAFSPTIEDRSGFDFGDE